GKHGRTIYSYVNYDIDPFSYWLQELRALTFSFLLGATLTIGEEIKKENILFIKSFNGEPTLETFVDFSLKLRDNFSKWQRNIFIIIVIFLPWTWFYWENITIYNDARYLFAAILFHSFWVISICLFSSPIISFRSHWWKMKTQIILKYLKNDQPDQIAQFEYLEPYPKYHFFFHLFKSSSRNKYWGSLIARRLFVYRFIFLPRYGSPIPGARYAAQPNRWSSRDHV